jgi:hypothetical protein
MPVYLLCFDKKFRHAKHYIGFVEKNENLTKRLAHHKKGSGSKLMAAISKVGIGFHVSRTWPDGDRNFERKLKNRKKSSELCPHCIAEKKSEKQKKALGEVSQRLAVLIKEEKVIAKLNVPPVICPVIKSLEGSGDRDAFESQGTIPPVPATDLMCVTTTPLEPVGPSVTELLDKAKEVYAQSQSDTNSGRWARIRSRLAGLWLVLKSKLISKR